MTEAWNNDRCFVTLPQQAADTRQCLRLHLSAQKIEPLEYVLALFCRTFSSSLYGAIRHYRGKKSDTCTVGLDDANVAGFELTETVWETRPVSQGAALIYRNKGLLIYRSCQTQCFSKGILTDNITHICITVCIWQARLELACHSITQVPTYH